MDNSSISNIFKYEEILPNQLNGKNPLEIMKEEENVKPEIEMTEDEFKILEVLREFTNTYDFDLLINFHNDFANLTDIGYMILLNNNFFGFLANFFGDSNGRLRTSAQVGQALEILLYFSKISPDITEQILGDFNNTLNYYLNNVCELRELSLLLCINFSSFPTIADSKYFNYDDEKISYLSKIYKYSSHTTQRHEVIEIYKNLAKIDIHQYEAFIQSIFDQNYMEEILSLTSTIKLLRYLSKKSISDERFSSQLFITNLKNALCLNTEKCDSKYVKNCLKFINIRCSNCLEAVSYFDYGFAEFFLELPDDFMDYISLIYIGIFDKVPEAIVDSAFLGFTIEKLNAMAHTGNYSHKIAAIKLLSKMIYKRRDLSQNETIINIIIDSFDLLLSFDLLAVLRYLDLLILVCQSERDNGLSIVIDKIIVNNIPELLNDISLNITELINENARKASESLNDKSISDITHDYPNISNRTQILYNLIYPEDENET